MALSVAPLLLHSEAIPEGARLALRDAFARTEDERPALLANVAKILYREADLDCDDALELLGLSGDDAIESPCGC
jgi:hypothetical protein